MSAKQSMLQSKDPICGMSVDTRTALNIERNGVRFYFCSESCRQKFQSKPVGTQAEDRAVGCCE